MWGQPQSDLPNVINRSDIVLLLLAQSDKHSSPILALIRSRREGLTTFETTTSSLNNEVSRRQERMVGKRGKLSPFP